MIQTELNQYSLYVDLKDIFQQNSQNHLIESSNQSRIQYNIPLHYNEIVLRGKGIYYEDVRIKIYSLRHEKFIRINDSDLLLYELISNEKWQTGVFEFTHLSDETLEITLPKNKNHLLIKNDLPIK